MDHKGISSEALLNDHPVYDVNVYLCVCINVTRKGTSSEALLNEHPVYNVNVYLCM